MKKEPLFIRFANGKANASDIVSTIQSSTEDEDSRKIASETMSSLPDLRVFQKDFRNALQDIIDNGVNQHLINYVNSYMKPSLTEYVEGSQGSRAGEKRWITIKEADTPWVEAVVCYNLCLFIRAFDIRDIKLCPVCKNFFSHKGKYAKYCSDSCKAQGKR